MRIQLTIGTESAGGELFDHPVARELAARLPLTLVFDDFNNMEKVARLDRALTLSGVPDADAPEPGEIGYYAPSQGLVLYYRQPGRWPGFVRMGRFAYDVEALRELADGTVIRIAAQAPEQTGPPAVTVR